MRLKLWLRLFGWALISFTAWSLLIKSTLLPALMYIHQVSLEPLYNDIGLTINSENNQDKYMLTARLFRASKPYPHGSYPPKLKVEQLTTFSISSPKMITMAYPLLWTLLLLLLPQKLTQLMRGTLLITPLIVISSSLLVTMNINQTLEPVFTDNLFRVWHPSGLVSVPSLPKKWWLMIQKPLNDALCYFTFLIAPICITVLLHLKQKNFLPIKK